MHGDTSSRAVTVGSHAPPPCCLRLRSYCSDFLKSDGDSDSDDDDDKRVVKSARDKRLSELAACCDEIRVGRLGWHVFVCMGRCMGAGS